MRIFNVHFVSVVVREVIHSAASQSVCCMCSVVLDDMDSLFHLTWLMPMSSTRVLLVSFPVWPRSTTSVSWFVVDGCGLQVVALMSLTVRTNGGCSAVDRLNVTWARTWQQAWQIQFQFEGSAFECIQGLLIFLARGSN